MSKQANPTIIGAFVAGAIALIVGSLILLGSGALFSDKQTFVTYFDGSIQGLRVGANVNFRGVRIGQVRDVHVRFDNSMNEFDLPVYIELEPGAIQSSQEIQFTSDDSQKMMGTLVEQGLRAKLQMESFVTGQLLVELDFYPDSPIELRGDNNKILEIPTIPSDIQLALEQTQDIMAKLRSLPVEDLVVNLISAVDGIEEFVRSPEMGNTLKGLNQLVNSPATQNITHELQASIKHLNSIAEEIKVIIQETSKRVNPVIADSESTLTEIQMAAIQMQKTFEEIQTSLDDDSVRYELTSTLDELRNAARSFRIYLEYLEQHPEAFLKGKQEIQ
ncbi:MAG: MlaD family protein [Gammaproteobacteria bacterium]|nr:MlaD family protein [Gammaproteobacteria bacterium]